MDNLINGTTQNQLQHIMVHSRSGDLCQHQNPWRPGKPLKVSKKGRRFYIYMMASPPSQCSLEEKDGGFSMGSVDTIELKKPSNLWSSQ